MDIRGIGLPAAPKKRLPTAPFGRASRPDGMGASTKDSGSAFAVSYDPTIT
jgi:hypothetical protein